MTRRSYTYATVLVGVVGAAVISVAPVATAKDLAAGVYCDNAHCTNDNDEAYVVQGTVWCSTLNVPTGIPGDPIAPSWSHSSENIGAVVEPHTSVLIDTSCSGLGLMNSWSIDRAYPRSAVPATGSWG